MSPAYTLGVNVALPYDRAVSRTRAALADQGFGILTEVDLRTTFREKLDIEVTPQVILGACRPQLAHRALEADPSVAAFLPCNVVVRSLGPQTSRVEAFDPSVMVSMSGSTALADIAGDARMRLSAALQALEGTKDVPLDIETERER
jgi:uncharacterized protein (DUF302 family)